MRGGLLTFSLFWGVWGPPLRFFLNFEHFYVRFNGVLLACHRGLPVGFLLLRCSVLFTVESLSLLYLLVIS